VSLSLGAKESSRYGRISSPGAQSYLRFVWRSVGKKPSVTPAGALARSGGASMLPTPN
jgi:hypothetical protein